MDKERRFDNETEERIRRVSNLPESYLVVLEQIIDGLKKDIFNKLVYGQYVDDLCNRFEQAIAEGKPVESIVGNDVNAFIIQYQKEVDFREKEPTKENKMTNKILLIDFCIFLGISTLVQSLRNVFDGNKLLITDNILLLIGIVFFVGGYIYKGLQYKKIGLSFIPFGLQIVLTCIVCYFLNFDVITSIISFGMIVVLDFMEITNYRKKLNKELIK